MRVNLGDARVQEQLAGSWHGQRCLRLLERLVGARGHAERRHLRRAATRAAQRALAP